MEAQNAQNVAKIASTQTGIFIPPFKLLLLLMVRQ